MKTKKGLVTLLALAIVTLTFATDRSKMTINSLNANQLAITVINEKVFNFEISVSAKNGDIVYYKQSDKPLSSYQKIFDVQSLENGKYMMRMKANDATLEKEFTITSKKIYLGESELSIEPYFTFDGNDLKFSYLNFKREKFNLEIYNDDELVYKTKIGNEFPINTGYDLSKLTTGNYSLVLSSFNKSYTYNFKK